MIEIAIVTKGHAPVAEAVNNVWLELYEQYPNLSDRIWSVDPNRALPGGFEHFIETANVKSFPTVFFLESTALGQHRIITRLEGNPSKATIKNTLIAVLTGQYANNTGSGPDSPQNEGFLPIGLLNLKVPKIAWLAITAFAAYKTAKAKKESTQIGFGALTAIAANQYFKS